VNKIFSLCDHTITWKKYNEILYKITQPEEKNAGLSGYVHLVFYTSRIYVKIIIVETEFDLSYDNI